jgi:hypothetical protein
MRDFAGFVETRQKLLQLKPGNRIHWLTFAVAHHINGNRELCIRILDEFENTVAGEEMSDSGWRRRGLPGPTVPVGSWQMDRPAAGAGCSRCAGHGPPSLAACPSLLIALAALAAQASCWS